MGMIERCQQVAADIAPPRTGPDLPHRLIPPSSGRRDVSAAAPFGLGAGRARGRCGRWQLRDAFAGWPGFVAERIVAGLAAGQTIVFPDDTSASAGSVYLSAPLKLEHLLAG
jgi:hypothetical protein